MRPWVNEGSAMPEKAVRSQQAIGPKAGEWFMKASWKVHALDLAQPCPALCAIADTPCSCPALSLAIEHQGKMERGSAAVIPFCMGLLPTPTSMASAGSPRGQRAPQPPRSAEQHHQLRTLQGAWRGKQERPARPARTHSPGERLSGEQG